MGELTSSSREAGASISTTAVRTKDFKDNYHHIKNHQNMLIINQLHM